MKNNITIVCAECGVAAKDRTEYCEHLLQLEDEQRNEFPVDHNIRIN